MDIPGYSEADQERWAPEPPKKAYRTSFERDRARVLHSSALRRLGAKTQVVAPSSDDFVRTRLTHSLEVAQVGRELGATLGCDPDVVDTACLAHDLGHPPFGHNGESALNDLAGGIGGFEGNAQTLRLLTRIETKTFRHTGASAGLNLTRATLDAACKYPWLRADAPQKNGKQTGKFGVYADDAPVFDWLRAGSGAQPRQTCVEAQVMDLADDISYSVHDVEDAINAGRFQLRWINDPDQRARVIGFTRQWYLPQVEDEVIDEAFKRLEATNEWVPHSDGSRRSMAALKDMTSQFIGRFCQSAIDATREQFGPGALTRFNAALIVPESTEHEIAAMKGLATAFVMTSDERKPIYARQRETLTELVNLLAETGDKYLEPIFAADWRDAGDDAARLRAVIDQVASLTDASAIEWHSTLVLGKSFSVPLF
ncbi:deoxyguanosinetriphosphate triphosphohydrolase [Paeniglutamicibacter gangotriensis]|uniref:Deoxyguanosinetriphosphate triphosphohydrolase-like protein n=1 Tax=Paeniglutamicibacter gangotriensis Lz1y TaxID=1276920 RepID=M7MS64_9MICC|nr:deoxyguanosinetriphosphate triphosphohydrolase [Paeniglutamicibacter gangotriensis]EMQ99247.1 deoxyguanosinetriphosphate triphosphohydrolase-like protein [Paeniglutamicibacter gangotriensis Lz1y]